MGLAHQRLHGKDPCQLASTKSHRQPFPPAVVINGVWGGCGSVAVERQFPKDCWNSIVKEEIQDSRKQKLQGVHSFQSKTKATDT